METILPASWIYLQNMVFPPRFYIMYTLSGCLSKCPYAACSPPVSPWKDLRFPGRPVVPLPGFRPVCPHIIAYRRYRLQSNFGRCPETCWIRRMPVIKSITIKLPGKGGICLIIRSIRQLWRSCNEALISHIKNFTVECYRRFYRKQPLQVVWL